MSAKDLKKYVNEVMRLKGLTPQDVSKRSGNKISFQYVNTLVKGITSSPSARKLYDIAQGLGVDPVELFRIAAGVEDKPAAESVDDSFTLLILELARHMVVNPTLRDLLICADKLSPEDQNRLLKTAQRIAEFKTKPKKRGSG